MNPHTHNFSALLHVYENAQQSRDEYRGCSCGAAQHVYTFAPYNIRHETVYDFNTYGAGFAYGMANAVRLAK